MHIKNVNLLIKLKPMNIDHSYLKKLKNKNIMALVEYLSIVSTISSLIGKLKSGTGVTLEKDLTNPPHNST